MCGLKKMFQDVSRKNFHQKAEKIFPEVYETRTICPYIDEWHVFCGFGRTYQGVYNHNQSTRKYTIEQERD